MSRWIALLMLFLALPVASAQEQKCPQAYSPWKQQASKDGVYYQCTYTFEPSPGDLRSNLVVWYPTKEDAGYLYYTSGKDKYWCRAFNTVHKEYEKGKPKWNVISNDANKQEFPDWAQGRQDTSKRIGVLEG